jgi:hypothetical protein
MSWLLRHLEWVLVGVALILSMMWISNYIVRPLSERTPAAVVDDHYVPPKTQIGQLRGELEKFPKSLSGKFRWDCKAFGA